jgi:hypothetical protein
MEWTRLLVSRSPPGQRGPKTAVGVAEADSAAERVFAVGLDGGLGGAEPGPDADRPCRCVLALPVRGSARFTEACVPWQYEPYLRIRVRDVDLQIQFHCRSRASLRWHHAGCHGGT